MEKKLYDDYVQNINRYIKLFNYDDIRKAVYMIRGAIDRGSAIFIIGNGGSMATSIHFAEDLLCGNKLKTKVFNLTNISNVTAISNDSEYDNVFEQQLRNQMDKDDLLICISCSGNSRNLVRAMDFANSIGETIGISGFNGGYLKKKSTHSIHIKTDIGDYEGTEDSHLIICHIISYLIRETNKS